MNLDQLTERVWKRLETKYPSALLIGQPPPQEFGFLFVELAPYEAVVLGILSPGQLLHMPSEDVCCSLLEGKPVYYWPHQPFREAKHGKLLQRELDRAERRLRELGIRFLTEPGPLLTMGTVRNMMEEGRAIPVGCRMTSGARALWERKHDDRWNSDREPMGYQKM